MNQVLFVLEGSTNNSTDNEFIIMPMHVDYNLDNVRRKNVQCYGKTIDKSPLSLIIPID